MPDKNTDNHIIALFNLYRLVFGSDPHTIHPMKGAGSGRKYFRLTGDTARVVGSWNPDPEEHRTFLQMSRVFNDLTLPVPEVIAADESAGYCLLTDLGDLSVFDWLETIRGKPEFDQAVLNRYRTILDDLIRFQTCRHNLYLPAYDRDAALCDMNYFRFCFLRPSGIKHSDSILYNEFKHLASLTDELSPKGFMYRDFQARNIFIHNNFNYYIDYQGAKYGPLIYDVVSLLLQVRAAIPQHIRQQLLNYYIEASNAVIRVESDYMHEQFNIAALMRALQVAGAYGYRGWFERKHHFLASLPEFNAHLRWIVEKWPSLFPKGELHNIIQQIINKQWPSPSKQTTGLHLNIVSFSYMKGIPYDINGHGGGYVFDCRLLPNPGRDPQLKEFTGIDPVVELFFQNYPEVDSFLNNCEQIVRYSVLAYQKAGYTNLQICFGCTGGKHRSVYSARKLAERLNNYPGVVVTVTHQDLNV